MHDNFKSIEMNSIISKGIIATLSFSLASCSVNVTPKCLEETSSAKITETLTNQINKELDAEVKKWDRAAANKDALALSKLYTQTADIIHYDNIQHIGQKSIIRHFEKQMKQDPHLKKIFSDHQRLIITPSIVIETAKSHITGSKIKPAPPTRGKYTAMYVKKNNEWLIAFERAWWTWPFKYD